MERKVYLDNASTTYVSNEVIHEMLPCFSAIYGNSNSLHCFGREASAIVDRSRDRIAKAIGSKSNEIYFTSGGTEANNWAIKGIAHAYKEKGNHIIVSKIEHESVLESCRQLEKEGFKVTYLNVDSEGLVSIAELLHYITKRTLLVSVMAVNNEVGTIQNIKTIAQIAHENGVLFHTDAVQAIGSVKIDVNDVGIDLMTISGHKIYGPKGVGALYVKKGINLKQSVFGGGQEFGLRSGTENTCGIISFGVAAEIVVNNQKTNYEKVKQLKNMFLQELTTDFNVSLNSTENCSPYIISFAVKKVKAETILHMAEEQGVLISNGSACSSKHTDNRILKAMGIPAELIISSVRVSFSEFNTVDEVITAAKVIKETCNRYIKILK